MFISPQLAASMPSKFSMERGVWKLEEKLDGHRIVVERTPTTITAWSRYGKQRALPPHITSVLHDLPNGIYDGELLAPGKRSYGVTELANSSELVYVVFDLLELLEQSAASMTYDNRRELLERTFVGVPRLAVLLATSVEVETDGEVQEAVEEIWSNDGEGAILKRRASLYKPGKRPKDWIKLKALHTAILRVVGFVPSKGEIQNRGSYATVLLQDDEGNYTPVKTLNNAELAAFETSARVAEESALFDWDIAVLPNGQKVHYHTSGHPAVGRKLQIEYQERTPDGSYRHGRWDRWWI